MKTLGVVSMKGGVGKTTLSANLAAAFARRGGRVAIVDLDPQNAIAWHFSEHAAQFRGICKAAAAGRGLGTPHQIDDGNLWVFPYGPSTLHERRAFEQMLREDTGWLGERLRGLSHEFNLVLIDTPPGHTVYLRQTLRAANVVLTALLPDMASFATVGDMEEVLTDALVDKPGMRGLYVVNQFEPGDTLAEDIVNSLMARFGNRFLPTLVHRDELVAESLALHTTVRNYATYSQASRDIDLLAARLERFVDP